MSSYLKSFLFGLKYIISTQIQIIKEKKGKIELICVLNLLISNIKSIIFNQISEKKRFYYYIEGKDYINWSTDSDRKYTEYFLKINDVNIHKNIFKSTHVFCLVAYYLLNEEYRWIWFLKNILKYKIIALVSNDISYYSGAMYQLKNIIDIWIAPSSRIYNYLKKHELKVILIPFYVSNEIFHNLQMTKKEICNLLNLNFNNLKNKIVIGSFQRDSVGLHLDKPKWQKNPDLLIKILKEIPRDKYVLLLAGPRRHYIVNECEKYRIPYIFYGDTSLIKEKKDDLLVNIQTKRDINRLYNLSDLYIVSSKIEGGPKAIIEACLTKTLIFSTDVGLARDFIHYNLIYSEKKIKKIVNLVNNFNNQFDIIKKYIDFNYNQAFSVLFEDNYKEKYHELIKMN